MGKEDLIGEGKEEKETREEGLCSGVVSQATMS
jgi:hypothetical protein